MTAFERRDQTIAPSGVDFETATLTPSLRVVLDFFHATTTGNDGSTIRSFTDNGIDPRYFSDGYGQGRGFYVWTTRESAIAHARDLMTGVVEKGQPVAGSPIIVQSSTTLDPNVWELDLERHRGAATEFLNQLIRRHGNQLTVTDSVGKNFTLIASECLPSNFIITHRDDNGQTLRQGCLAGSDDSSIALGKLMGRIFEGIRRSAFCSEWKDNLLLEVSSKADTGMALRYFGDKVIPVQKILPLEL